MNISTVSTKDLPKLTVLGFGPCGEGNETFGMVGRRRPDVETCQESGYFVVYLDNPKTHTGVRLHVYLHVAAPAQDGLDASRPPVEAFCVRCYSTLGVVGLALPEAWELVQEIVSDISITDHINEVDRLLQKTYHLQRNGV